MMKMVIHPMISVIVDLNMDLMMTENLLTEKVGVAIEKNG